MVHFLTYDIYIYNRGLYIYTYTYTPIAIAIAIDVSSVVSSVVSSIVSSVVDVSSIAGNVDVDSSIAIAMYKVLYIHRRRSTSIAGRFNGPPKTILQEFYCYPANFPRQEPFRKVF